MPVARISLDDALFSLMRRPVLVVGPAATVLGNSNEALLKAICEKKPSAFQVMPPDFYAAVDAINAAAPELSDDIRLLVRSHFKEIPTSANVSRLAHGQWGAVVSLTSDMHFEDELRARYELIPSSWTATVIDHHSLMAPPQTTPIYKLLGSLDDPRPGHTLAISTAEVLRRKQTWSRMLSTLSDYYANAPLLFVGTDTAMDLARDLLGALYACDPPYPRRLLFLPGDGTAQDPTVLALASEYSEVAIVDAPLKDFCDATASLKLATRVVQIRQGDHGSSPHSRWEADLAQFRHLVDVVPSEPPSDFDANSHQRRLLDGLFRPTSLDWLPFLFDFDLRRTDSSHILGAVENSFTTLSDGIRTILLRGESGVGKSTCCKRLAIDLAKKGYLVLWCKRPPHGVSRASYVGLGKQIAALRRTNGTLRPVLICDDPLSLRVPPHLVGDALESAKTPVVFVIAARNSDVLAQEGSGVVLPLSPDTTLELHHTLDDAELASLEGYLVKVGADSPENAKATIASVPSADATDILCSLWYLLPDTRAQLSASLHDEYVRLGGASGSIECFARAASDLGDRARAAYECVAVTSNLGMGLPLEVLIRTIQLSYDEWAQMCVDGKPVWGLLYDETDQETGNIVFKTRNHIVARVLLELVNGGAGHAGEFRVLRDLVSACVVGTIPYRAFIVDLLVARRRRLESILSYQQGCELYEIATTNFPHGDSLIEHHYGNWHRQKGGDPLTAYSQYEKALRTSHYQYAERSERPELIHTSMAAAVVEMVRKGRQTRETALELVQNHLREATSPSFLDPHTDHVFANLLFQLARVEGDDGRDEISLRSLAEALRTIERTLQLIGSAGNRTTFFVDRIRALHELQRNIISSITDVDTAIKFADECFENSQSQAGFEVVVRLLLADAEESGRGGDYKRAYEYIDRCIARVSESGRSPTPELYASRADVFIRWRLQQPKGPIDWRALRDDLERVVRDPKYQNDIVRMYYFALALFHCEEYTTANAIFVSLRRQNPNYRIRTGMRNWLAGKEGLPVRLQGEVRKAHGKTYIYSPQLGTEMEAFGREVYQSEGAIVQFYVEFSMSGPYAVFERPREQGAILP